MSVYKLSVFVLGVFMLSTFMLSIFMLSIFMLSVIELSVVYAESRGAIWNSEFMANTGLKYEVLQHDLKDAQKSNNLCFQIFLKYYHLNFDSSAIVASILIKCVSS